RQNFVLSVTFCSIRQSPILLRLLRLVTADVTLPLQKRSMFTRVVALVTAVTPRKSPGGGKVSHAPTRASSLILTEGYGRLRKHIFKLWTLEPAISPPFSAD